MGFSMDNLSINGYQIYNSFLSGLNQIEDDRDRINEINVFPVADGDTGNNLVRTVSLIAHRLEPHKSASTVLERIASLSLDSARGNSGLIFSQFLNGLAIFTKGKEFLTIQEFSKAAIGAAKMAYEAVEKPVEGTILTILNIWAKTLEEISLEVKNIEYVFEKALVNARTALENTKNQLEILRENNVIDAGAMGFVSFLQGIDYFQKKGSLPSKLKLSLRRSKNIKGFDLPHTHNLKGKSIDYRYCTEVLLEGKEIDKDRVKNRLSTLGDSMVITKGVDRVRVHIHTNYPNRVVEIVKNEGRLLEQKAEDMFRQEQVVNSKLGRIAVLTDSIADIPRDLLDKYQVHLMNLKLIWGNEEYLDRLTITSDQFYKEQVIRSDFPGSSIPSESEVDTLYRYLLDNYDGIIVLPVGKLLSGTWNLMSKVAVKINPEGDKISVINTCLNSVAQGLLVQEVAKKAVLGANLNELKEFANSIKGRIKIYVSVDTFKYMVKGGRVSPLKGFIATVLNLKPIVSLDENGKGAIMGKAFSRRGLMKKIIKIIKEKESKKGIQSYALVHADDLESAKTFSRVVKNVLGMEPDYISSISSIVGMHSGKGAIALSILENE